MLGLCVCVCVFTWKHSVTMPPRSYRARAASMSDPRARMRKGQKKLTNERRRQVYRFKGIRNGFAIDFYVQLRIIVGPLSKEPTFCFCLYNTVRAVHASLSSIFTLFLKQRERIDLWIPHVQVYEILIDRARAIYSRKWCLWLISRRN